jgi:hypothetical protein
MTEFRRVLGLGLLRMAIDVFKFPTCEYRVSIRNSTDVTTDASVGNVYGGDLGDGISLT